MNLAALNPPSTSTVAPSMNDASSEAERATTTDIAFTAWGIGATVGTFVGGELLGAGLLLVPFVIGVVEYVAASAALPPFFGKARLPEEA
jgi:MFS family permease